jgi:hypothetical protein
MVIDSHTLLWCVVGEVVKISEGSGVVADGFETLECVSLDLQVRTAQGDGENGGDGGFGVAPEWLECSDGGSGEAVDFGGEKAEAVGEFGGGGGIGAASEFEGALDGMVMKVASMGLGGHRS